MTATIKAKFPCCEKSVRVPMAVAKDRHATRRCRHCLRKWFAIVRRAIPLRRVAVINVVEFTELPWCACGGFAQKPPLPRAFVHADVCSRRAVL